MYFLSHINRTGQADHTKKSRADVGHAEVSDTNYSHYIGQATTLPSGAVRGHEAESLAFRKESPMAQPSS